MGGMGGNWEEGRESADSLVGNTRFAYLLLLRIM